VDLHRSVRGRPASVPHQRRLPAALRRRSVGIPARPAVPLQQCGICGSRPDHRKADRLSCTTTCVRASSDPAGCSTPTHSTWKRRPPTSPSATPLRTSRVMRPGVGGEHLLMPGRGFAAGAATAPPGISSIPQRAVRSLATESDLTRLAHHRQGGDRRWARYAFGFFDLGEGRARSVGMAEALRASVPFCVCIPKPDTRGGSVELGQRLPPSVGLPAGHPQQQEGEEEPGGKLDSERRLHWRDCPLEERAAGPEARLTCVGFGARWGLRAGARGPDHRPQHPTRQPSGRVA